MRTFILTILLLLSFDGSRAQERILVAAASDLRFAMDSIAQVFESTHRAAIAITFGSSGKLTEQIINGAPFDVLLSADLSYPQILEKAHMTSSPITAYARGRIVLWSGKVDVQKNQMNTLLDPGVARIAIANPRHAPYGKRALESLQYHHLLDKVTPKLVYGENVSQAAQFATSGAADAAIISYSVALSTGMRDTGGHFFLIPEESHEPLIQGAVVTRQGARKALARAYIEYLKSMEAIAILKHYGFTTP